MVNPELRKLTCTNDDVGVVHYSSKLSLFALFSEPGRIVIPTEPIAHDSMAATVPSAPCSIAAEIRCLDQLREFVHLTLCRRENLLEFHFPMSETELKKNGVPCGLQFVLHGPRQVRLAAVWAADCNEILMYAANGRRFGRVRLPNPVVQGAACC